LAFSVGLVTILGASIYLQGRISMQINRSKDGVLVSKPHTDQGASTSGFATSAAATIKDFEEGIASMKKQLPDVADKSSSGLAGKFRSLQQLTAKLNVFA
jgi:hypothetical protein